MIINHRKISGRMPRLVQLTKIAMACWSEARAKLHGQSFEIRFEIKDRSYSLSLDKNEALELHNQLELHLNACGKIV